MLKVTKYVKTGLSGQTDGRTATNRLNKGIIKRARNRIFTSSAAVKILNQTNGILQARRGGVRRVSTHPTPNK